MACLHKGHHFLAISSRGSQFKSMALIEAIPFVFGLSHFVRQPVDRARPLMTSSRSQDFANSPSTHVISSLSSGSLFGSVHSAPRGMRFFPVPVDQAPLYNTKFSSQAAGAHLVLTDQILSGSHMQIGSTELSTSSMDASPQAQEAIHVPA